MAKRYYVCDVIGDGSEENPFRPVVADLGVNWVGEVSADNTRAFVLVNAVNHAAIIAHTRINALPDFPLDGKINAMQTAARNAMNNALTRRGFSVAGIDNADGYRDVIRSVGRSLNPNFNENNFDVAE
jgi:hypothetical protein